jgi:hypothetical protein
MLANPALNLVPFGHWALRDEAAQRRLCQTFLKVRFPNARMTAKGTEHSLIPTSSPSNSYR